MKARDPSAYREFKNRGRVFYHVENGWCGRQLASTNRWRVYFGVVAPGSSYPLLPDVYREGGGEVEFAEFEQLVRWVEQRRK